MGPGAAVQAGAPQPWAPAPVPVPTPGFSCSAVGTREGPGPACRAAWGPRISAGCYPGALVSASPPCSYCHVPTCPSLPNTGEGGLGDPSLLACGLGLQSSRGPCLHLGSDRKPDAGREGLARCAGPDSSMAAALRPPRPPGHTVSGAGAGPCRSSGPREGHRRAGRCRGPGLAGSVLRSRQDTLRAGSAGARVLHRPRAS